MPLTRNSSFYKIESSAEFAALVDFHAPVNGTMDIIYLSTPTGVWGSGFISLVDIDDELEWKIRSVFKTTTPEFFPIYSLFELRSSNWTNKSVFPAPDFTGLMDPDNGSKVNFLRILIGEFPEVRLGQNEMMLLGQPSPPSIWKLPQAFGDIVNLQSPIRWTHHEEVVAAEPEEEQFTDADGTFWTRSAGQGWEYWMSKENGHLFCKDEPEPKEQEKVEPAEKAGVELIELSSDSEKENSTPSTPTKLYPIFIPNAPKRQQKHIVRRGFISKAVKKLF